MEECISCVTFIWNHHSGASRQVSLNNNGSRGVELSGKVERGEARELDLDQFGTPNNKVRLILNIKVEQGFSDPLPRSAKPLPALHIQCNGSNIPSQVP